MWKLYRWNGHYIQGDLISEHRSEDAAVKKAKKEIDFLFAEKVNRENEVVIWLDGQQARSFDAVWRSGRCAVRRSDCWN